MKISADKEKHSYFNAKSSGLFLGIIFCLILFGILGLSIWATEISKSSEKVKAYKYRDEIDKTWFLI